MYPANHKTVFVLDHTPYFGISCEVPIEFDFIKGRTPGFIPLNPISKSLWTCSVESAIEYCRIVWDLFPQGKLIKFIASDTAAHILNGWGYSQQNVNHIMNGMSIIGVPPMPMMPAAMRSVGAPEPTVIHGLRAAIDALSESTETQVANASTSKFLNKSRVICITSARDNDSMKRLEEIFHNVLQTQNKHTQSSTERQNLMIDHCHLVIINTYPINIESQVSNHPPKSLSSVLTTEVHSISAPQISNKLSTLILEHYDLASTTVTGIPMKEEQNASSSANYDVEIYHSSAAHTAMLKGSAADSAAIRTIKEGSEYETVTLIWRTPRSCSAAEMQNCTSMHRITPVDVNSRPSLCLINFLLNGRSVMLEMPRAGGKLTSHLLASHGGEIFIHTLCTSRSVLEDPPSISEGCGGRVTDYRIPDFGMFIQQNRLFPPGPKTAQGGQSVPPMSKLRMRLSRHTKYWPLTINSTYVYNMKPYLEPLTSLIMREQLTDDEVLTCKQVIYNIIGLESKHEPLHLTSNVGGGGNQRASKGAQKREEQYKAMWNELETLIKHHLRTEQHRSVYGCLLECHKFSNNGTEGGDGSKTEKMDVDSIKIEPSDSSKEVPPTAQRASVIRATTDSPMSPPPLASIAPPTFPRAARETVQSPPKTLLDLFLENQAKGAAKGRPEFCGRSADTPIAKLYPNLKLEGETRVKGEAMVVE